MFILLPYEHDRMSVKRLPWVSIAILALNLLAFLLTRRFAPEAAAEYVAHHALCGRTLNYHRFDTHLYWKRPEPPVTVPKMCVSVVGLTSIAPPRTSSPPVASDNQRERSFAVSDVDRKKSL